MEESRIDRLERAVIFLILGLLPLHLYLSFSNLVNGIDKGHGHSFPMGSYVLIGVYLMSVLASDVFMFRYGKFEASRALRRYWLSACAAVVLVLFLYLSALENDAITLLCLLYSPYVVLVPLLELLEAGVEKNSGVFSLAAVGTFCLVNWAICRFAVRDKREGEAL